MWALVFDRSKDDWEGSKGFRKARVPRPTINENDDPLEALSAIVRVRYTGVCGSDRGIWFRESFKQMIHESLDAEGKDVRIIGHELLGEIAEVGSLVTSRYGFRAGDIVSAESHLTCGKCHQCLRGERHVCQNEHIIGFSYDGCFAEYIKLPAHFLWKTDTSKINEMVGAIQEPFGNAVHASTVVDLRGKPVGIFGLGTIGLFTTLTARALGATSVIGIEPKQRNTGLAERLGIDAVVPIVPKKGEWRSDPDVVQQVSDFGDGGVDVAFEMSGFNSSVNNAINSCRQGGSVVLFGIKSGDFKIENFSSLIVRGLDLQSVIGRRIFQTWEIMTNLLHAKKNGIHDLILDVILNNGEGTVVHIDDFDINDFEKRMVEYPKLLIKWI
jgi:threonine 3-dehydrogenase